MVWEIRTVFSLDGKDGEGQKEVSGVMEMFYILIKMKVIWVYILIIIQLYFKFCMFYFM